MDGSCIGILVHSFLLIMKKKFTEKLRFIWNSYLHAVPLVRIALCLAMLKPSSVVSLMESSPFFNVDTIFVWR